MKRAGFHKALLVVAAVTIGFAAPALAHITAPNPGFDITSDFGPRFAETNRDGVLDPDFHRAIDYRAAARTPLPRLEEGNIIRLSFEDGGINPTARLESGRPVILILELQTLNSHRFRYLHMFNNDPLPIHSDDFTLSTTTLGNLCIIHWIPGTGRTQARYAVSATQNAEPVQVNGIPVLDSQGGQLVTQRVAVSTIGPSGTSGGFDAHMHIDIGGGVSENPLAHIEHPVSNFGCTSSAISGIFLA